MANPSIFRHQTSSLEIFKKNNRHSPKIYALTSFYPLKKTFNEDYSKNKAITAGELKFVDNSLQFINGSLSFNNYFSYNEKYKTVSFWILINEENEEQTIYYEGFEREKQVIIMALRGKTLVIKSEPIEYDIDFSSHLRKMDSYLFISRRA